MLRKLKGVLFGDQIELCFHLANLNSSHSKMNLEKLNPLLEKFSNPNKKSSILSSLNQKLTNQNYILKLKTLIAVHYLIKHTADKDLIRIFSDVNHKQEKYQNLKTHHTQQQLKSYVQIEIINKFQTYLAKLCRNFQSFNYSRKFYPKNNISILDITNHGFQTINLVNNILHMQQSFCKMGRYYIEHHQIVSLFISYLNDLNIYNSFIKLASKYLLQNLNSHEQQQIKHVFLFVNQAQKTSDRLYQFYYIRYFYYLIKSQVQFPQFLKVEQESYYMVQQKLKKIDKNTLHLVKISTNPQNQTQPSLQKSLKEFQNGQRYSLRQHYSLIVIKDINQN